MTDGRNRIAAALRWGLVLALLVGVPVQVPQDDGVPGSTNAVARAKTPAPAAFLPASEAPGPSAPAASPGAVLTLAAATLPPSRRYRPYLSRDPPG
jgi:hypothetical protein